MPTEAKKPAASPDSSKSDADEEEKGFFQRLRHVIQNLQQMSELADAPADGLLNLIQTTYSLEHEHALLELARRGAERNELMAPAGRSEPHDDSELFE